MITVSTLATIVLVGTGCTKDKAIPTEEINSVVETYMKHTLGTIFRAEVDYEKAKKFLTPDLEVQFVAPMFVPVSYCIQNGPSNVRITSTEFDSASNWTNVVVEGKYGENWNQMWNFVVVEVEGDDWMINKIECLNN